MCEHLSKKINYPELLRWQSQSCQTTLTVIAQQSNHSIHWLLQRLAQFNTTLSCQYTSVCLGVGGRCNNFNVGIGVIVFVGVLALFWLWIERWWRVGTVLLHFIWFVYCYHSLACILNCLFFFFLFCGIRVAQKANLYCIINNNSLFFFSFLYLYTIALEFCMCVR